MNLNGLPVAAPSSPRTAALWEAASWSVVVSHKGRQKRFAQSLPYARVGSHPGCEIVLDNPRLPPVAYLLVAFEAHLEAWPVAPIAMPRWGALAAGEEFPVGTFRISVDLDPPATPDDAARERFPELGVVVGDRRWSAKLHRRVTIVGDDHPSVKRLRDVGLEPCHGAFVAVQQRLWYLPLSPHDAPYLTNRSVAVELRQGEQVQAGRVQFLRLPAEASPAADRGGNAKPQAVDPPVDPPRAAPKQELPKPIVPAAAIDSLMLDMSAAEPKPKPKLKPPADASAKPRELCPDGFTNQVTDRMVRMGRRRVLKARLMLGTAVSLAVLIAALVLLKIWNSLSAG